MQKEKQRLRNKLPLLSYIDHKLLAGHLERRRLERKSMLSVAMKMTMEMTMETSCNLLQVESAMTYDT